MSNYLNPLITIGLPVFNGGEHIREAIDSILAQSFSQFRLIISDNCSTDNTYLIINEYKAKDPRISVVRHPSNIGGLENLLHLTKNIETPYFMWFAHDDVMENNFLEVCVKIFTEDSDIDMAFTGIRNIDINGNSIREYPDYHKIPHETSVIGLIKFIFEPEYHGQANLIYSLYKTTFLIKSLKQNINTLKTEWGPDVAFLFSLLASGAKIKISEKVLFNKRSFQPPSEVGTQLSVPTSYIHCSVESFNYHSLRNSLFTSTIQHKRSSILILAIVIRQLYLSTIRLNFNIKNSFFPNTFAHISIKTSVSFHKFRHRINLGLRKIKGTYNIVFHKVNIAGLYAAKKIPLLKRIKRFIFKNDRQ